jgi:hypothetical protein
MNVKNLRKNYKTLSLIERHSLFISAVIRKDKSEETAITNASPKMLREMPDFTHLYSKVLSLQMIVLIHKADAWTNWQLFSEMETEQAEKHSRLAFYFFFVYSDAWTAVCEKLKIDAEAIAEMLFPGCFFLQRIALADEDFRELAFTEAQAREFIGWFAGEEKFAMTLEAKIKEFCDFLELPEK